MIQTELNWNEWKLLYLMDFEVEFDWHKYIRKYNVLQN